MRVSACGTAGFSGHVGTRDVNAGVDEIETGRAGRGRPDGASVRAHLFVLIGAVLLPLLILAVVLGVANVDAQRRVIEEGRRDVINNLTHLLDRDFARVTAVLQTLAAAPELDSLPSLGFRPLAGRLVEMQKLDAIGVFDRSGQLLATSLPLEQLPRRADTTPIAAAFDGGIAISGFEMGLAARRALYIVSVPIIRNGRIDRVLSAGVGLERLSGLFAEAGLRDEWVGAILDRNGAFVARSQNEAQYLGKPARPEVVAIARSQDLEGALDAVSFEGVAVTTAFRRSSASGWTSVVAVPKREIDATMWGTVAWLFPVSAGLIGLSLIFASLTARRISEPVRALGEAARALGEGRVMPPMIDGIRDFRDVATAFATAAALAGERTAIQQRLAASERRYRVAMSVVKMGSWETNLEERTRTWTPEAMTLFGLSLPDGAGHVGGDDDEYRAVLHPDDRHVIADQDALADRQDMLVSEYRIVRPDGSIRWLSGHALVVSRAADGKARTMVNVAVDITERKHAEQHALLLMEEVNHRAKNLLGVVQAIMRQTFRRGDPETFAVRLSERVMGLAASHDLLVETQWQGVGVADLVAGQLAHFSDLIGSRVLLDGPAVRLSAAAAQGIGMALHELATNAGKYGALANPEGRVRISWRLLQGEREGFGMSWREEGGPAVAAPSRRGFGHLVMGPMAAAAVQGTADLVFHASGVVWTLTAPIESLVGDGGERRGVAAEAA